MMCPISFLICPALSSFFIIRRSIRIGSLLRLYSGFNSSRSISSWNSSPVAAQNAGCHCSLSGEFFHQVFFNSIFHETNWMIQNNYLQKHSNPNDILNYLVVHHKHKNTYNFDILL